METAFEQEVKVRCEVCLKEVPPSEAEGTEAVEFVRHFCGVDCYEEWINSRRRDELD